jgi:iron complex transport system permease protein
MKRISLRRLNIGLFLLLCLLAMISTAAGMKWYGLLTWFSATHLTQQILLTIRLPRTLAAILVGGMLALSGQLMQNVSHNPIADPSILGVNAGAMLALMVGGLLGLNLNIFNSLWLSILGAGLAFVVVLGLAMRRRGLDVLRFILGGTVVSSLITCIAYAIGILTNQTAQYRNLLVGGFANVTMPQVHALLVVMVILVIGVACFHKELSLLILDDSTVRGLGVRPARTRLLASVLVVLSAAMAVAVGGNIGFVGLGVPQIVSFWHPDRLERNVLPTMLLGASFMLTVDILAKTLNRPNELPLSALSAICGGIFLMVMLNHKKVVVA